MVSGVNGAVLNGKRPRFDRDRVWQAAAGREVEILSAVAGIPLNLLDERGHPCPKCGGKDRFSLVDSGRGAVLCRHCFSKGNGDFLSAVQWARGVGFADALRLVGEYCDVPPEKLQPKPFDKQVRFDAETELVFVEDWAERKPGIGVAAAIRSGVRTGVHPKYGRIVAFEGVNRPGGKSVGITILRVSGDLFPPTAKRGPAKNINLPGSKDSWVIAATPDEFKAAHTVVRVEGPTDLCAIADKLPEGVIAVTNICGASPSRNLRMELFAGKRFVILSDADKPGEVGASRLAGKGVAAGCEVFAAPLPFEVTKDHGKDVRDFVAGGGDVAELLAGSEPRSADDVSFVDKPKASDADPSIEAGRFLEEHCRFGELTTLRHHRDAFYRWSGGRYQLQIDSDIRAEVFKHLDRGFCKLSASVTTNVVDCVKGIVNTPSSVVMPCWIGPGPKRRSLLSAKNGILDVESLLEGSGTPLLPHTPEWFSEAQLPYAFVPGAECPLWLKVLRQNTEGDAERIAILQEWFGYCLLPTTGQQKFLMLHGEGGTGKSTVLAALIALLGRENISSVSLERFDDRFSLYGMLGKLANVAAEIGEIDKAAEGYLKSLTSGDPMDFERKYHDPVSAVPTARLVFSTNNLPRFADRTSGLWRRMILVPFERQIPESEKIRDLAEDGGWHATGEMPGMLNWAIEGLRRLRAQGGFTHSSACDAAREVYRRESNPAVTFLAEQYRANEYGREPRGDVYAHYRSWCEVMGYKPLSESHFGKEVRRAFPSAFDERPRIEGKLTRCYGGITKGAMDPGE